MVGANAQGSPEQFRLPAIAVSPGPTIDGRIDENEWPESARREGFFDRDTGVSSDERGEFWLCFDKDYIYASGRFFTNPSGIVRDEYRQNVSLGGNDSFSLSLSTTGLPSNFNEFATNASGATRISLSGGRAAKTEWLGEIEAKGRVTETGWECEMRIPWKVMSLPINGLHDLRFNIFWYRSNKQNTYAFRYTRSNDLAPTWAGVQIPVIARNTEILLLPYAFGGYEERSGFLANAGLDFKTSLTPQINLVGTINPDFRNIESSILSLDFSYFERLSAENRPFFQEGAQYLRTGYDNRLFAPQRIANFDAGINVYGQLNPRMTLGALTTVDFGNKRATAISSSYRPTNRSNAEFAYVENDQPGLRNQGGMLNYFQDWANQNVFFTNQFTNDQVVGSGWRNNFGWGYHDSRNSTSIEYLRISEGYFPRLGFAPERNLEGGIAFGETHATPACGVLNDYEVRLFGSSFRRLDGSFYRNNIGAGTSASFRSRIGTELNAEFSNFEGSADHLYSAGARYPVGDPYRGVAVRSSTGSFLGEDYSEWTLRWDYKPLSRVQLSGSSQFVDFRGHETLHILSARYDVGQYESIGGRLVDQNGDINWYLSYRLSGRRGAEYFLLVGDPRSNRFQNRMVFKAVFPFSIRF